MPFTCSHGRFEIDFYIVSQTVLALPSLDASYRIHMDELTAGV